MNKLTRSTCLSLVMASGIALNIRAADQSSTNELATLKQRVDALTASNSEFSGFNFGLGLSLTLDPGKNDRVKSAEVDANNIVRVTESQNDLPRFILESHYFFTPKTFFGWHSPFGLKNFQGGDEKKVQEDKAQGFPGKPQESQWGWGPFVAVEPGSDIIDAVGAGVMLGFRRKQEEGVSKPGSFNLGVGAIVDRSVQVLGDGLEANKPLPAGDKLRFKKTAETGILFVFSVAF